MSIEDFDPDNLPKPPFLTDRLILRPFADHDAEQAHAALDTDEDVWTFDPGYAPSLDDRRRNLARYAMLREHFGFGPCGAWTKDGAFVGQGGLNPHIFVHRDGSRTVEFEVMYKLARPYWGQGYAKEIARFWVDFAFRQVGLGRLITCVDRDNAASVGVLRSVGARIEDDWLEDAMVVGTILPVP
jgi:RimJ/RimL family protein N-acetyltransferase